MGAPIKTEADCLDACCEDNSCTVYQFAAVGASSRGSGCWTWSEMGEPSCTEAKGWEGGKGRKYAPPPPPPPPGAPLSVLLPSGGPAATKLPFTPNISLATAPSGEVIGADSVSLLLGKSADAMERFYDMGGEVHLARLPCAVWREQLLRMKAGGLNSVAIYVFWIHHEEKRGVFDFTGRRDVRRFVMLAAEVGLKVLMRVGPWDHGECRNGGHPDWVLNSCGRLRSTDPKYMSCVSGWYSALAQQLEGLFWKDGGPIALLQVDNETTDWKYLLALRSLAMSLGILPAIFTKTGWPGPAPGYPSDYPMLPFFGGYPDAFWSGYGTGAAPAEYTFAPAPSLKADASTAVTDDGDLHATSGWQVPAGYPWLDIEIGGGMAASYSHRIHLQSDDMPAMHLCDVGAGVNALGYYMYHGGNNPHSTIYHDMDDPAHTLQESSFQPAGAANPMPSISYDFFAPLGEMGQPRGHYHSMRRMHTFLQGFGSKVAATTTHWPWPYVPAPTDNTTLRWVVRRGDPGSGSFIFINNYERTGYGLRPTMPPKTEVRLELKINGSVPIAVPSAKSDALTIPSDVWAVWPCDLALLGSERLAYATAQLVARVASGGSEVLFLVETEGVQAEVAFTGAVTAEPGKATVATEGHLSVFRKISAGTAAFASVKSGAGTLQFVLLPASMADSVWLQTLDGAERLFVTDATTTPDVLLMADNKTLHFRSSMLSDTPQDLRMFPAVSGLKHADGSAVPSAADGVFTAFKPTVEKVSIAAPTITKVRAAGPARNVSQGGRPAREPTMEEWHQAEVYNLTLTQAIPASGDYKLAVDYVGDAARIYFGERCLTDNWQSGYKGEGAMEVGLNYLAGENEGLLEKGAQLSLWILPITQADLSSPHIYLQRRLWPDFGGAQSVLKLNSVSVAGLVYTDMTVA